MLHRQKGGLVVVRRTELQGSAESWTTPNEQVTEPRSQYRGFDGDPWPLETPEMGIVLRKGLASIEQLGVVGQYLERARHLNPRTDLIFILQDGSSATPAPKGFGFVGWDIGYYESEWNSYSFLFNEVICGRFESLSIFSSQLNEYALSPTMGLCHEILSEKSRLSASGASFESESGDEFFRPIGIAISSS